MPKSKAHKFVGTTTGLVSAVGYCYCYQHDKKNAWQFALGGAIGGYVTSRLPDILEPAETLGPNHRGLFHGLASNGAVLVLSYASVKKWLQALIDKAEHFDSDNHHFDAFLCRLMAGFVIGSLAGLTSHLAADLIIGSDGLPLLA